MTLSTTQTQTDPRLLRWKRVLQHYQNESGSYHSNDAVAGDTLRQIMVKVLKSITRVP